MTSSTSYGYFVLLSDIFLKVLFRKLVHSQDDRYRGIFRRKVAQKMSRCELLYR
jgi:hypothetical protein